MSPRVAEAAAAARVTDLDGGPHALRELWQDRTAVLVFLRHFG
jgi:hypothetical protein